MLPTVKGPKYAKCLLPTKRGQNIPFIYAFSIKAKQYVIYIDHLPQIRQNMTFLGHLPQKGKHRTFVVPSTKVEILSISIKSTTKELYYSIKMMPIPKRVKISQIYGA